MCNPNIPIVYNSLKVIRPRKFAFPVTPIADGSVSMNEGPKKKSRIDLPPTHQRLQCLLKDINLSSTGVTNVLDLGLVISYAFEVVL